MMFMKNKANFENKEKRKKEKEIDIHTVQERVNTAGPRLPLQRPSCKVGPWLASENLALEPLSNQ